MWCRLAGVRVRGRGEELLSRLCRKHQVFENLTLAASNVPQGEREPGGQSSMRRQDSLLKGKEIDVGKLEREG